MLTLTDNAVKRFKDLLKGENSEDYGIRIFTTGGCCSTGIAIDTADSPKKGDIILLKKGAKVFLEKEASQLLSDAIIDFEDEQGFIITGMQQTSFSR